MFLNVEQSKGEAEEEGNAGSSRVGAVRPLCVPAQGQGAELSPALPGEPRGSAAGCAELGVPKDHIPLLFPRIPRSLQGTSISCRQSEHGLRRRLEPRAAGGQPRRQQNGVSPWTRSLSPLSLFILPQRSPLMHRGPILGTCIALCPGPINTGAVAA